MATIAWLIPSLLEGSGGHRTILQHADYLQKRGHHCVIYVEESGELNRVSTGNRIRQLFGFDFSEVFLGWSQIKPADMVFATVWYSARVVRDLPFETIRCYFVQDLEAQFNPVGDAYFMAENSYRYGLRAVTIGRWLAALLEKRFGTQAAYFDFCADLAVYKRLSGVKKEKAVCFIYQPEKYRRCPGLGLEALGIVKHLMPEVKIYLYGSRSTGRVWFEHENLGLLDLEACNRLYNRCAVGLCISGTNPSRIPFEMMAAGLPVVELCRDNTRYDFPEEAVLLCEPTPEALARGILRMLGDPVTIESASKTAERFMQSRPITYGLDQFHIFVEALITGRPLIKQPLGKCNNLPCLEAEGLPSSAHQLGPHQYKYTDQGRLSFLPLFMRRVVRHCYRRLRAIRL